MFMPWNRAVDSWISLGEHWCSHRSWYEQRDNVNTFCIISTEYWGARSTPKDFSPKILRGFLRPQKLRALGRSLCLNYVCFLSGSTFYPPPPPIAYNSASISFARSNCGLLECVELANSVRQISLLPVNAASPPCTCLYRQTDRLPVLKLHCNIVIHFNLCSFIEQYSQFLIELDRPTSNFLIKLHAREEPLAINVLLHHWD